MRRSALLASLLLVLLPAASSGQMRILAGVGVTNPIGDLNDVSGVGWHAAGGFHLAVAALPVGLRADGAYHSLGEDGGNPSREILAGALSLTVSFPGIGLQPYVLGGVGMYRTSVDADGVGTTSDSGIHGAFGVDIGQLGFGGYAELRFVNVSTEGPGSARYVSATLGIRL